MAPIPPAIRPIGPDDAEAVAALWHAAWHDAHDGLMPPDLVRHRDVASFAGRLAGFGPDVIVAEDHGGIAGFAVIVGPEVDQFFLARHARGTGLADRLMDAVEARLEADGVAVAWIDCVAGNERALRFYRRRGFVETATTSRAIWMPDGLSAEFPMHRLAKQLGS